MAWVTWGFSALFAASAFLTNHQEGVTTTGGMVLCTIAIILAAAACTQHIRAMLCAFDHRIDEAHALGRRQGRCDAMEEQQGAMHRVR